MISPTVLMISPTVLKTTRYCTHVIQGENPSMSFHRHHCHSYPEQYSFLQLHFKLLIGQNPAISSCSSSQFCFSDYFFIIYLQSECIEKCQLELFSKYDKKHDLGVILG